jgi:hypothetical protein
VTSERCRREEAEAEAKRKLARKQGRSLFGCRALFSENISCAKYYHSRLYPWKWMMPVDSRIPSVGDDDTGSVGR